MNPKTSAPVGDVPHFEAGSFRDRDGRVFYDGDRVLRCLSADGLASWNALAATKCFAAAIQTGQIVGTRRLPDDELPASAEGEAWAAVLEHERIRFISYPFEWSFGMLKDAALLQLELLDAALNEDLVLKDASPYNVQWSRGKPVFIDVLSFERLEPGTPWVGYRQFCQLFLYPLLLQAYKQISFQPWLRGSLDGITPADCSRMMSLRDLFRRGVFTHVYLHAKLQQAYSDQSKDVRRELRSAGFHKLLIKANVSRLKKLMARLSWNPQTSEWRDYATQHSYSDRDLEAKKDFVRTAASEEHRALVWDLGCNIGTFSQIAAEYADCVIAMDGDQLVVERLYQSLKAEGGSNVLPLVVNVADPSPNLGWRGLERRRLAERGKPSLVLCLALLHHLVIGANIPLREFIDWLANLGGDVVIEFVTRDDPMVKKLLCNKTDRYRDYDLEFFEECLGRSFDVAQRRVLASQTRILYHARAKS